MIEIENKNKLVVESAHKDLLIQELEVKVHHLSSVQDQVAKYQEQACRLETEVRILGGG